MLVISGVLFGGWLLLRGKDPSHISATEEWMMENIWRVESFKQKKNGTYDTYLLEIEPAMESSFSELRNTFGVTEYNNINHYYLSEGVNCQGMTVYLADWCERNRVEYAVSWTTIHTFIYIRYGGVWYKFNFDAEGSSVSEVASSEVQKGMITS